MIEVGQLRRWKEDGISNATGNFLVIRHQGRFIPIGFGRGDEEDHWEILFEDNIEVGWGTTLLEEVSEAVS